MNLLRSFRRRILVADADAVSYPGIVGRVHVNDTMLGARDRVDIRHYRSVGLSALDNIENALDQASRTFGDIGSVLDLPCGYGRVLRWLTTAVPPSVITACDLDVPGVEFCAREFGVGPLLSREDLHAVAFPHSYDLIWVGSLVTHLPPESCLAVLDTLTSLLNRGGVPVFTTHGESCLDNMRPAYSAEFRSSLDAIRAGVAAHGVHFWPYVGQARYGMTVHARAYVDALVGERYRGLVSQVYSAERGWDSHQDVWAWQRL